MTKRDELLALAERCEKACEGSRELDAAIYETAIGLGMYESIYDRSGDLCIRDYPGEPGPEYRRLPRYSTSLDAAMTLVPTGHDWSLFFDNGSALAGCMPSSEDGCDLTDVPGATPALALCAAALRAQAEMES